MSNEWPLAPLGEVVRHRKEFIEIEDTSTYKRCRVQLHAQGVVLRDQVEGVEIKTKKQQVCRANDFLVAEIDAKLGGYGIVPPDLEAAIVSSHYFLFSINESKLLRDFLAFFIRTPAFADQVAPQGSTNYAAIRPSHVLAYQIPLPPIQEQRRIVAHIQALSDKINELRRTIDAIENDADAICRAIISHGNAEQNQTHMRDIVSRRPLDIQVKADETYQFAGVYCFGRGVFRSKKLQGTEFAYRQLTRLRAGDFVYPKLMAWEGALAIVPPECDGCAVSPEFPVFELNPALVLPETLDVYFRTPSVWPALSGSSTGTNVRRRRLNPDSFLDYAMPLPPLSEQRKLAGVKAKVEALKQHQRSSTAELDALLPSILDRAFLGNI